VGAAIGTREDATIDGAADALDVLREALGIGTLARYGVTESELAAVIA